MSVRSTAFRREITSKYPRLKAVLQTRPFSLSRVKQCKATSAGFTLMELIIVLTILAVMSAAAIPIFSGSLGTTESNHAVNDFKALIKYGQERAVTDLREYRLYLDPENGQYFLMTFERTDEGKKIFKALDEKQGEAVSLPRRLTMDNPSAKEDHERDLYYVSFYPSGACDEATIVFKSEAIDKIEIKTGTSLGKIYDSRDKH